MQSEILWKLREVSFTRLSSQLECNENRNTTNFCYHKPSLTVGRAIHHIRPWTKSLCRSLCQRWPSHVAEGEALQGRVQPTSKVWDIAKINKCFSKNATLFYNKAINC